MKRLLIASLLALTLATSVQAELVLRQSTASQTRQIGPFVDSAGAILPALTISNTDVRLSKQGAASVTKNSGGCTYDANGMYLCTFDATDSNTAGSLQVTVVEAGALPVYHEFQVAAPSIFDACCTGTSAPLTAVDVWTVPSSRVVTAVDTDGITATSLATSAGTELATALQTQAVNTGTAGSVGERLGRIPNAAPAAAGGLPTVNASNQVAGVSGNVVGSVGSVASPVTVGTNNDKTNYALSAAGNEAVLNVVVEDMGNISARCMMALLGSVLNGDFTTAGSTTTFRDNTGTEVRMTSTQTTTSRVVTVTCPTY